MRQRRFRQWVELGTVPLLLLLVGAAPGLAARCLESPRGSPTATVERRADPSKEERAREFFDAFPSQEFRNFEEAEAVAGFRIPRAGVDYPVAFGKTHLQWYPDGERPISQTQYSIPPALKMSVGIIVGVESSWDQRDGTPGASVLMLGDERVVGGKAGWFRRTGETGMNFSYRCGEAGREAVWCIIRASTEVGEKGFEAFVSSVH